jgi:hypothetical protein
MNVNNLLKKSIRESDPNLPDEFLNKWQRFKLGHEKLKLSKCINMVGETYDDDFKIRCGTTRCNFVEVKYEEAGIVKTALAHVVAIFNFCKDVESIFLIIAWLKRDFTKKLLLAYPCYCYNYDNYNYIHTNTNHGCK